MRYVCDFTSPWDSILSIKEVRTCAYVLVVNTPLMCAHAFVRETARRALPYTVRCEWVDDGEDEMW